MSFLCIPYMLILHCGNLTFLKLNMHLILFFTKLLHFCHAMLCISAAYAVMRCLSVCPSVTFVSYIKTNKDILEFFSLSGSQAILVFPRQTGWRYSDGNPPNGGHRMQVGYRQKSRFWSNSWPMLSCGVCLSVHLSRSWVTSKRIKIS